MPSRLLPWNVQVLSGTFPLVASPLHALACSSAWRLAGACWICGVTDSLVLGKALRPQEGLVPGPRESHLHRAMVCRPGGGDKDRCWELRRGNRWEGRHRESVRAVGPGSRRPSSPPGTPALLLFGATRLCTAPLAGGYCTQRWHPAWSQRVCVCCAQSYVKFGTGRSRFCSLSFLTRKMGKLGLVAPVLLSTSTRWGRCML